MVGGCKKKLAQLGRQGRQVYYADLFTPQQTLCEGHDFDTQQQLRSIEPVLQTANPFSLRLIIQTLRDIEMLRHTGQLPGGLPYSHQPAYKVALYRAYWQ